METPRHPALDFHMAGDALFVCIGDQGRRERKRSKDLRWGSRGASSPRPGLTVARAGGGLRQPPRTASQP